MVRRSAMVPDASATRRDPRPRGTTENARDRARMFGRGEYPLVLRVAGPRDDLALGQLGAPPRRGIGERLRAADAGPRNRGPRHATIRSSTAPCFRTSSAASLGSGGRMPCVVARSSRFPSIPSSGSLLRLPHPPGLAAATLATPSLHHSWRSPPFSIAFAPSCCWRISSFVPPNELAVVRGQNWTRRFWLTWPEVFGVRG